MPRVHEFLDSRVFSWPSPVFSFTLFFISSPFLLQLSMHKQRARYLTRAHSFYTEIKETLGILCQGRESTKLKRDGLVWGAVCFVFRRFQKPRSKNRKSLSVCFFEVRFFIFFLPIERIRASSGRVVHDGSHEVRLLACGFQCLLVVLLSQPSSVVALEQFSRPFF